MSHSGVQNLEPAKRRLILRLSSLGDIILCSSALQTGPRFDWLTATPFGDVLKGHPKLARLIEFDRSSGFRGLKTSARELWEAQYDEVYDLHRSLRTRAIRLLFWIWDVKARWQRRKNPSASWTSAKWRVLPKERWRLWGYFLLKGLWPKSLRPRPLTVRAARVVGGSGAERPDLTHLLSPEKEGEPEIPEGAISVMPSSLWEGKKWPLEKYMEVIRATGRPAAVLGTEKDHESYRLASMLEKAGVATVSGVARWSLPEVAGVLSRSEFYLGSDTGLAHLAEAVGTPAHVIFGPTTPDMGFGPWKTESRSYGSSLWCRPCGKDGRACFRSGDEKYLCQKTLSEYEVIEGITGKPLPKIEPNLEIEPIGEDPLPMGPLVSFEEPEGPEGEAANQKECLAEARNQALLSPSLIMRFYRRFIPSRINRKRFGRSPHAEFGNELEKAEIPPKNENVRRVWFHAASVGELESLWSVVQKWLLESDGHRHECVVTVFSPSAFTQVRNLCSSVPEGKILFGGFSPAEGSWHLALEKIAPDLFVTAKYEAWPELWCGLSERKIPLVIVGARNRRSLRAARTLTGFLGGETPEMLLLPNNDSEAASLLTLFPDARLQVIGDPRWDRVAERAQQGSPRVRDLISSYENLPRPWGVLGSAWPNDIKRWGEMLAKVEGTLWVVPHHVDARSIREIELLLQHFGLAPVKTSQGVQVKAMPGQSVCLIVDEMGFLAELYLWADWAYVGGGFGAGVHSTIEPALHGIPLAVGPAGVEKFPEISELRDSGQLHVIKDSKELWNWYRSEVKDFSAGKDSGQRKEYWKAQAQSRMGATERGVQALSSYLSSFLPSASAAFPEGRTNRE